MRSRQEIKANARFAIREQRGQSILTVLLVMIVVALGSMFNIIPGGILGSWIVLGTVYFVDLPLTVNSAGIFTKIYNRERASAEELFSNFPVNYLRKVGGMLWMGLFVALWSLLLFIPGVIKAYSYSMAPFILANCPNVTARDALKLSMRMTNGHKMDLFIMHLSFIGWGLLSLLTCGILSIVFTGPYMQATSAGYFVELRDKAIATGTIHHSEFYPEYNTRLQ
ncbi:MAG: DUF975 family protein [Defluviitaleaceae bacterium]|nr:DUF975 family protein [Defluviitaleaceae bacterium]